MRFEVDGKTAFASTGSGHADTNSPAVLFVHGAGHDHTVWVMPARHFARQGFCVRAVDLPGHGRSDGPALTGIEDMAAWLDRVMAANGIAQAAIVGHSMGALVAYAFAREFSQRCRTLTVLGPSVPMPVTDMLLNAAEDNDHAAIEMANTWSHNRGKLGANENPGMWMMRGGERLIERSAPGVFYTDLAACNAFNLKGSVDVPTLVLVGEKDQMTPPRRGLELAENLPDARVVSLPGCGHAMMSEAPNAVLDALITNV